MTPAQDRIMKPSTQVIDKEYTFGIYILVLSKGFTRVFRTPVYLLDNVPDDKGGWGMYLPHGICIADYDKQLFQNLLSSNPDTWQQDEEMKDFIQAHLDLLFPGIPNTYDFIGDPYTRYQYSLGRQENRLYWMIPISVSFFDAGKTFYKSRSFMNTWRWYSLSEIRRDSKLCSIVSYILDPVVDVCKGEDRRRINRTVFGIRDSVWDVITLVNRRWGAFLTLLIASLTALDLGGNVLQTFTQAVNGNAVSRMQTALLRGIPKSSVAMNEWLDRYLSAPISTRNVEQNFKEGCLIQAMGATIDKERQRKLREKLNSLSIIYGPYSCGAQN
jgi:hypothetical protein